MPDKKELTGKVKEAFIVRIEELSEEIKVPHFSEVVNEMKKFDVTLPENYDRGLDEAVEILGKIQKYRDVLTALKLAMTDKRNSIRAIWTTARDTLMIRDPEIKSLKSLKQQEAACQLVFKDLHTKLIVMEDNLKNSISILENVDAKFNVCSRQITVIEMQMKIGEYEGKRRRK